MIDDNITSKKCKTCGIILPIESYAIRRWRSSADDAHWIYSYYGDCRKCISTKKCIWRNAHNTYMHDYHLNRKQNEN